MKAISLIKCALCLLLVSCGHDQWSNEKIHSHHEKYSYSKVNHRSRDPVRGIDLEIVQSFDCLKTYLIVHSTAVPALRQSPKKIKVKIEIDNSLMTCDADRFDGGQRFLLPEDSAAALIEALLAQKNVIISIPGYHSEIPWTGFVKHFRKLGPSFVENPFHLPF
jgi:hypothetical protein